MIHPTVWLSSMLALALSLSQGVPAAGASGAAALTVRIYGGATKTSLRLQPGFATVLRADRRIDTVAIGDPRLVTATTVKRGQDVYDLVLQPQATTGATNMVVWFGELTSVWDLLIGPGQRTADIVYVMAAPAATPRTAPAPRPSPPPSLATPPSSAPPTPLPPASAGASRADARPEWRPSPHALPFLETQQALGNAVGVFQVFRGRDGVWIRYRITNNGTTDFSIRPSGVLVRVNGRLVPFGMARDAVDKNRPALLPGGATETGVIDAPAKAPRQIEVIFALFPVGEHTPGPTRTVPLTFQALFAGLDGLQTSSAH